MIHDQTLASGRSGGVAGLTTAMMAATLALAALGGAALAGLQSLIG